MPRLVRVVVCGHNPKTIYLELDFVPQIGTHIRVGAETYLYLVRKVEYEVIAISEGTELERYRCDSACIEVTEDYM